MEKKKQNQKRMLFVLAFVIASLTLTPSLLFARRPVCTGPKEKDGGTIFCKCENEQSCLDDHGCEENSFLEEVLDLFGLRGLFK